MYVFNVHRHSLNMAINNSRNIWPGSLFIRQVKFFVTNLIYIWIDISRTEAADYSTMFGIIYTSQITGSKGIFHSRLIPS